MLCQPTAFRALQEHQTCYLPWCLQFCNMAFEVRRIIEGELALRANANRQLKEIEKRLLLIDQLATASPMVKGGEAMPASAFKLRGESREKLLEAKEELEKQVCLPTRSCD